MMNQTDLIRKIGNILAELQEQHQSVTENPQQVSNLELELFLSNANFLTDHIQILMKSVGLAEVKELAAPKAAVVESEPATFEFVLKEEASALKFDYEDQKVEEIFNRPLSEEEQQIIARKKQYNQEQQQAAQVSVGIPEEEEGPEPFLVTPVAATKVEEAYPVIDTHAIEEAQVLQIPIQPPAPVALETAHVIVAVPPAETPAAAQPVKEQPRAEQPAKLTLNEMLGGSLNHASTKAEEPLAEISDLRQAISLNDKLLYVKDLFHGYSLAYAEVIELLNKMPDYNSADAFLQKNYAVQNNWAAKPDTVARFYELLKRRFPVK